jgi:hypothetical protein
MAMPKTLPDSFCVFILTHGRPDRVHTYDTLMQRGYTGRVFIVIDDEDKTADEYRKRFGDKVLQFCKADWAEATDEGDNFQHRKAIVYARNACWYLAKQVGCRWFCQMDDDYTSFQVRHDSELRYVSGCVKTTITEILQALLAFYVTSQATAIALSQGGDHIGGGGTEEKKGGQANPSLRRKCMNSWICDIERPFRFFGHMNEDVSAYVTHGRRGMLFLTVIQAMLVQKPTQVTPGGMSDLYLAAGTYVKSFYTVMAAPSCVQIGLMGDPRGDRVRIHHKINWHKAAPKILSEQHRKSR